MKMKNDIKGNIVALWSLFFHKDPSASCTPRITSSVAKY